MPERHCQCFLQTPEGARLEVTSRGLVIGRGAGAEVPLSDPSAPRRQALLFLDVGGPRIVVLDEPPVDVNGNPVGCDQEAGVPLSDGDHLRACGSELRLTVLKPAETGPTGWILRHGRKAFQEIPHGTLRVGGGPGDDVHLFLWPPGALEIRFADDLLTARSAGGVMRDGEPLPADTGVVLDSGDRLVFGEDAVQVLELNPGRRAASDADPLEKVILQPMPPVGGQVTVGASGREKTAWLPGLPFRLVHLLLNPPEGWRPGDELADPVVLSRIWGQEIPMDPQAVARVATAAREALARGGIDGTFVERVRSRTRFRLAEGTSVVLLRPR